MRATGIGAHATVRSDKTGRDAHAGTTAASDQESNELSPPAATMTVTLCQIQESITPAGSMDSGPAPKRAHPGMTMVMLKKHIASARKFNEIVGIETQVVKLIH
jgi:hypothetical protein